MYQEVYTKRIKKDLKLVKKQGKDRQDFETVVEMLKQGIQLPAKYKNHRLSGDYIGCWDCQAQNILFIKNY